MKAKKTFKEVLLRKAGIMDEYERSKRLYKDYKRTADSKTLEELNSTLEVAEERLDRAISVYQSIVDAINKDVTQASDKKEEDAFSYLHVLKGYYKEVTEMRDDIKKNKSG